MKNLHAINKSALLKQAAFDLLTVELGRKPSIDELFELADKPNIGMMNLAHTILKASDAQESLAKEFRCPYCDKNKGDESNNFCCSETHCRWVWVDQNGNEVGEV